MSGGREGQRGDDGREPKSGEWGCARRARRAFRRAIARRGRSEGASPRARQGGGIRALRGAAREIGNDPRRATAARTLRDHADAGGLHRLGALLVLGELAVVVGHLRELAAERARVEGLVRLGVLRGADDEARRAGGARGRAAARERRARVGRGRGNGRGGGSHRGRRDQWGRARRARTGRVTESQHQTITRG